MKLWTTRTVYVPYSPSSFVSTVNELVSTEKLIQIKSVTGIKQRLFKSKGVGTTQPLARMNTFKVLDTLSLPLKLSGKTLKDGKVILFANVEIM